MTDRQIKQFEFLIEIDKMKSVFRRSQNIDGKRAENDAEHSWHLCMLAVTLKEYFIDQTVDLDKTIKLLLMHDLVEVYAGDTFCYDQKGNESKAERENNAADKLFALLPKDQGELFKSYWKEFEDFKTTESKFANAVDRIQPFILNVNTDGHTWKQTAVTVDMIYERMNPVKLYLPSLWEYVESNVNHYKSLGRFAEK